MADFRLVSGQLEGFWRSAMEEAEAQGRIAGAAAGREEVLRLAEKLAEELHRSGSAEDAGARRLLASVRQHLAAQAPAAILSSFGSPVLTEEERVAKERWEADLAAERASRHGQPVTLPGEPSRDLQAAQGIDLASGKDFQSSATFDAKRQAEKDREDAAAVRRAKK